jgi:hypothetical protein
LRPSFRYFLSSSLDDWDRQPAWFLSSHALGTGGYKYDASSDRVVPVDVGSTLADIDINWDQSDEGFTGHADIADNDDDRYNGFTIDIAHFSLDQPSRSRILGDDMAPVAMLGIPTGPDDAISIEGDDDSDHANQDDQAMDLDEDVNTTIGSSLTESTQNLTLDDSLATLLANEFLDPSTIRQAILTSRRHVLMTTVKQSRLTTWLSLPAAWEITHKHKSKKRKRRPK